ncbi:MAG: branched-chain amino acid ABC transporter permease [Pseudomonadota bacterium]
MELGPHLVLALLESAVSTAVLALTAIGLALVFGIMRVVNVAHGEFFMLGAVFAWWIADTLTGWSPAIGFVLALLFSPVIVGAVAYASDRIVISRVQYDPERTIVATVGLLYIFQQLSLMTFGPDARPVEPPFNTRLAIPWFEHTEAGWSVYWPWGLSITSYKLAVIATAIVLLIGVWLVLTRTKLGLIMRATQQDKDIAQAFGIRIERVYALVFAGGGALAALGAVLIVPIQQAHYLMGGDPLLLSFIVVILGGLGSLSGTLLAAAIIGLSNGMIAVFFSPTLAKILATLLVAVVLIWRPHGLFVRANR